MTGSGDASLRMSIRQVVSRAASRAFWALLADGQRQLEVRHHDRAALVFSSITWTEITLAGESALPTNVAGSSE